jgi:hypothetical protein
MGMRYKDYVTKMVEELEIRVEDIHRRGLNNSISQKEFDEALERIKFIISNIKGTIENEDVFMSS